MTVVNELVRVESSPIHGQGGFARQEIAAGTRIIEYVGEKISKAESIERCQQNNEYIFYLNEEFDLDGSVEWNLARFLNHSCEPNCDAESIDGRIWIIANRAIQAGEELVFDYGYDLEEFRDYPCRCGVKKCRGYIVAEVFNRQHAAE